MADLDAAPPERKIDDVKKMTAVSIVTAGSATLGVAVGPRQFIADQLLANADVIRAMHENVQLCQDLQKNVPSYAKVLVSVQPHTVCECTATRSCRRNELLKSTKEVRRRSLEKLFPQDSRRTAWCKPHLAEASLKLDAKERETRRLRHTWEHSQQPDRDDTGRSHRWPPAATAHESSPHSGH